MAQNQEASLKARLAEMKSAFSNYNMVRMREALRYLSGPKLKLFVEIPFLIHVNQPGRPGYIADGPDAHGIYNFKDSGFFKAGINAGDFPDPGPAPETPCVLGLYHIGSLGTFTQSAGSDFDYWVIIDKTGFTRQRYYNLEKKLNHIVRYARESFDQQVSFFIMDQADIRRDCYAGFDTPETMIAPKLFLKEEFYRTFLMIAGKIPVWTILPANIKQGTYTTLVSRLSGMAVLAPMFEDFIDLGRLESPGDQDILRGILWHICKSRADPVKALIKATMILAHKFGTQSHSMLLCDEIKQRFGDAGIDDYTADPYKVLFDRVIDFHETHAQESLNLIKNAIFFRLCGYPEVQMPEEGSPKRQLLDRYIRTWNLTPSQVRKLVSFPDWSESEKRLLERTFVKRLAEMYQQISQKAGQAFAGLDDTEKRNLKILVHKTRERLNLAKDKIQESSTYLARLSFEFFLFRKRPRDWELSAYPRGSSREVKVHRADTFLGLMGWIIENRLYSRSRSAMKLDLKAALFSGRDEAQALDRLYLDIQPVKPLSDQGFEHPAQWSKIVILLVAPTASTGIARAEFLAVNTWGEMFEDQLVLDTGRDLNHRYKDIAEKIKCYGGERPRLLFYQLGSRRDPDAVYQIKQYLPFRFQTARPGAPLRNRPLLDRL